MTELQGQVTSSAHQASPSTLPPFLAAPMLNHDVLRGHLQNSEVMSGSRAIAVIKIYYCKNSSDQSFWACWDKGYPSEIHLQLKSRQISFYNIYVNLRIALKFCTEQGSGTVVLCAIFQNVLTTERQVMDTRDYVGFEFKMHLEGINYIATAPCWFWGKRWLWLSTRGGSREEGHQQVS